MANDTSIRYAPAWVDEPNKRGTWSILYSCLFTLSLCVWTAIHLNIPQKGERDFKQTLRKIRWVIVAIFAPEVVLYSAWQQFYLATRFTRELQNICRDHYNIRREDPRMRWEKGVDHILDFFGSKMEKAKKSDGNESKETQTDTSTNLITTAEKLDSSGITKEMEDDIRSFSLRWGLYAIMGGFVVDAFHLYDNKKARWHTLTPRGMIQLAKGVPWKEFKSSFTVDEAQIKDKSKADGLAKMLVLLQVLWAFLNVVSRVVEHYPITVLEIHTLVHAACAMCMYILWWKKPLDIRDPTTVDTENFRDQIALMLMRTPDSIRFAYPDFRPPERWVKQSNARMDSDTSEAKLPLLFSCLQWFFWLTSPTIGASNQTILKYWIYGDKSEAMLMQYDTTQVETIVRKPSPLASKYSVLPQVLETPASGVYNTTCDSRSSSYTLPNLTADFRLGNRPESTNEIEPCSHQDDVEASLGVEMQLLNASSLQGAGICLGPPKITEKRKKTGWFNRLTRRSRWRSVPLHTSLVISTGEFLQDGIGPAPLITGRDSTLEQKRFESLSTFATNHMPSLQSFVNKLYLIPQTKLSEMDPLLVQEIQVAKPLWTYPRKQTEEAQLPAGEQPMEAEESAEILRSVEEEPLSDLEHSHTETPDLKTKEVDLQKVETRERKPPDPTKSHFHKICMHLSDKDLTRWSRASRAFAAEKTERADEDTARTLSTDDDYVDKHKEQIHRSESQAPTSDNASIPAGEEEKPETSKKIVTLWKRRVETEADIFAETEFCKRSRNMENYAFDRLTTSRGVLGLYVAFSLVTSAYAGAHSALWNYSFPSSFESSSWKLSVVCLGAPAPVCLLLGILFVLFFFLRLIHLLLDRCCRKSPGCMACFRLIRRVFLIVALPFVVIGLRYTSFTEYCQKIIDRCDQKARALKHTVYAPLLLFWIIVKQLAIGLLLLPWIVGGAILAALLCVVGFPLSGFFFLYIYGRFFIVLESFISLRKVPIGVYEEVSWSKWIPHL